MSRSPGILATREFVGLANDTDRLLIRSEVPKFYTVTDGYQNNQCVAKVDIKEQGLEPTNYTLTIRYSGSYRVAYVRCEILRGNTVIPLRLYSDLFSVEKINGWYTYTAPVNSGIPLAGSTDFYYGDIVKCSLDNKDWVTEELIMWDPHNPWTISMTGTE